MQAKEYQQKALDRLSLFLNVLAEKRVAADQVDRLRRENPGLGLQPKDFAAEAFEELRLAGEVGRAEPYSPRIDGMGQSVPNITFKVPTGGGKTYMAVQAATMILSKYFDDHDEQFVLWLVPSEAIYSQTLRQLRDVESPLRRSLNIESGNRVRVYEKESPLHRADLKGHLNILLLMLPSANRQEAVNKLRMFRDRGNVNGFLPMEDDHLAHEELLRRIPNLDRVSMDDILEGVEFSSAGLVRSSLGNALRFLRPLIVLDEGHKGFSDLSQKTLLGFNPRFILELSATPRDSAERKSNLLVNISGRELDAEQMIKMPIMLDVSPETNWKSCLREAWQRTEELTKRAAAYRSNTQQYIRPIMLVQVERTGLDQRGEGFVHTEDAREYLIELGLEKEAIAVKTSAEDELKTLEVKDLLSERSPIRVIITKQALQEGWDCSFAYVLCSLAVGKSVGAMTQLIGRILRQPYAQKTGVPELDQCYVHTFQWKTQEAVEKVKQGLMSEGLGDLMDLVQTRTRNEAQAVPDRLRREQWRSKSYYLPQVLVADPNRGPRPLDWEQDILGSIAWEDLNLPIPECAVNKGQAETAGGARAIYLDDVFDVEDAVVSNEFDPHFALRALLSIVPNPWIAQRLVDDFLASLLANGWTEEEIGGRQRYLIGELERLVSGLVDTQARHVFESKLASGEVFLDLVAEKWWELPHQAPGQPGALVVQRDDGPWRKSVFETIYPSELNGLELKVACFVDKQEAVAWWYRNVVRGRGYAVQGWRRSRIYPDFILAQESDAGVDRWIVIETKGDHLLKNQDSEYKKAVFERLSESYSENHGAKLGQLTLFERPAEYVCELIGESDWENRIRGLLGREGAGGSS